MTGTETTRGSASEWPNVSSSDAGRRTAASAGGVILLVGVLYLTATGRWGSYLAPPGLPLFVTDVVLLAAVVATIVGARRSPLEARAILRQHAGAPLALLLCLSLLGWAVARAVVSLPGEIEDPLTALRDLAPYGYAVASVVAYLQPWSGKLASGLVYGALTTHVTWILWAPRLPGWPARWPTLGDAAIFTARPDFDGTVLGSAVALALYRLLLSGRSLPRRGLVALVAFGGVNAYALATLPSRAGLLAGLFAIGVVVVASISPTSSRRALQVGLRVPPKLLVAGLVLLVAGLAVSPAGQRLAEVFRGDQGLALGTVQAREVAWSGVVDYVTSDASRTAIGVGFGPDFILDSGTQDALEGTQYDNVRSPHNYLLGTLARLGVAGGLLAGLLMVAAGALAVGALRRSVDEVTALAALLVLSLPLTAFLGVILESPFGALPYFWAVGHLARSAWEARGGSPATSLT